VQASHDNCQRFSWGTETGTQLVLDSSYVPFSGPKLAADYPVRQGCSRKVGDELGIGNRRFTIVGLYNTGSLLLDNTIVMDIDTARQLLNVKDQTVSCFLVEPVDPARIDAVAEAIEQAIPGVDARTMSEFQAGAAQVLGILDMLLLLIIGLSLIVGSVGILNTMLMSTSERFAEFGILRTNGWSRGDVLHLVLAESVCLGLLAGVAGCLLALGGVTVVNRFLGHGLQFALTPGLLALGLGLAAALGTLGGPARFAPGADGDHPPGLAVTWPVDRFPTETRATGIGGLLVSVRSHNEIYMHFLPAYER